MKMRYVAAGLTAITAGAVVAGTMLGSPAGAAEERDVVVCNWTPGQLDVEVAPTAADDGYLLAGWNVAMAGPGCAPALRSVIGREMHLRLTGADGVPHETTWYVPGQNMRLDVTGDVAGAQYGPTYW